MDKKQLGDILFYGGLAVWIGSHVYALYVGGLPDSQVMMHNYGNIIAFGAYVAGYMIKHNKL